MRIDAHAPISSRHGLGVWTFLPTGDLSLEKGRSHALGEGVSSIFFLLCWKYCIETRPIRSQQNLFLSSILHSKFINV